MQALAARFQERNGSLICRELLGLEGKTKVSSSEPSSIEGGMGNHQPQARTKDYYATRPCKELVGSAAEILEAWLEERKATGQ